MRKILFACFLCCVLFADFATAATIYVNTDNTGTEDGTTVATGWSTLAEALTDAGTLSEDTIIECSGATADTVKADTGSVTLSGFTLTIRGNRSEGDGFYSGDLLYSTSHYRLEPTTSYFQSLQIDPSSTGTVVVDGIQITVPGNTFSSGIDLLGTTATVINNRIKGSGSNNDNGILLGVDGNTGKTYTVQNNIVFGVTGTGSEGINIAFASFFNGTVYVSNNTVFNTRTGILWEDINDNSSSSTLLIHNNAVANNTTDYTADSGSPAVSVTVTYNASDDLFGSNTQDLSPGSPESGQWPNHWTDPNNGTDNSKDFTVVDAGNLDDNGTTGTGIPTTDILGMSRSGSTPDIGAFEEAAATASPLLLKLNTSGGLTAGGMQRGRR